MFSEKETQGIVPKVPGFALCTSLKCVHNRDIVMSCVDTQHLVSLQHELHRT
jgi:hypothetical protein